MPLNESKVVGAPPVMAMLKTVPSPSAPPASVVPYRVLPLSVKPPHGFVAVHNVKGEQRR